MPESNTLITQTQSTSLVLRRTKDLLALTDKLLNDNLSILEDPWWQRLWTWADEQGVDDLYVDRKNWNKMRGLPREKKKLLVIKDLRLYDYGITELPKEIFNLTNLTVLDLGNNDITELPREIGKSYGQVWCLRESCSNDSPVDFAFL